MNPATLSRRTVIFVNIAHALDHFVLLIYPTAVLAIAAELGLDYATLIALATGAFVAFGLFALPSGWAAERLGRRNMLGIFYLGCAAACAGLSTAASPTAFAGWLLLLGIFSAIYHPIGSAMLVTHASRLGRDLGWNGVWGNLGAAAASGVTALIAVTLGWRLAFLLPALVCAAAGAAFLWMVRSDGVPGSRSRNDAPALPVRRPGLLMILFGLAILAGGITFNVTTIALPKIIDERLGLTLPLLLTGSLATVVFVFGALTQLAVGRLIDRISLPAIFVGIVALAPLGLGIAGAGAGFTLLLGLTLAMVSIYGQVVITDAMVARYVPPALRTRAFAIRYFLGFTVSGFALPLIALLHGQGGFSVVLGATALVGGVILACAIPMLMFARHPGAPEQPRQQAA